MIDAPRDLLTRQAQVHRPEGDLCRNGRSDDLVIRVLEHDPDPLAQRFARLAVHGLAIEQNLTALRRQHPVQAQEKGGLPRPVRAEHRNALARMHIE